MINWKQIVGVPLDSWTADIEENNLVFAGEVIPELARSNDFGPMYVYAGALVKRRIESLRQTCGRAIRLKYAVKANPNPELLRFLSDLVDGFDASSIGEIHSLLNLGVSGERISISGPGKSPDLLAEAVAAGIIVSAESETELERLIDLGRQLRRKPAIVIRINPDFTLRESGMRMSGLSSPFGIDSEVAEQVLRRLSPKLDLRGIHIFCGSQCLSSDALIETYNRVFSLASELTKFTSQQIKVLNIGAGFGVPYFAGDEPIDLPLVMREFKRLAEGARYEHPKVDVEIELGRFIVGEAGIYVCTVIDKKVSRGETFLVTNGGMHHHLAASGNLGQVIKRNFPMCLANRVLGQQLETVNIAGALCTPLDLLARAVDLPVAEIGDTLAIFQSGAYGFTASPLEFLSHPKPIERFIPP